METLRLDQLRIDGGTQLRVKIDLDHVAELKAAWGKIDDLPPFVAFFDGAAYWIADGFHRFHAANGKWTRVTVDVRAGTQRDAVLFACGANQSHGLKRSNADKRKAVKTLLDDAEWSAKSDQWIAEAAGVNKHMIAELRGNNLSQVGELPPDVNQQSTTNSRNGSAKKRLGRDGKQYPASKKDADISAEKKRNAADAKAVKAAERKAASDKKKADALAAKEAKASEREAKRLAKEAAELAAADEAEHLAMEGVPKGLKDSLGHEITNGCGEIFRHVTTFTSLIQQLGKIVGEAERLSMTDAGHHLNYDDFKTAIKQAQTILRFAKPYCPAPPIERAKDTDQRKRWEGIRYLVEMEYRQLTDKQKAGLK